MGREKDLNTFFFFFVCGYPTVLTPTLENSIIFRDGRIKKGAIVKNSIIMQGTRVEEDAILSGVITDMEVVIGSSRMLAGTENMPFIINKGKLV